jgi:hypothetical protein
MNTTEIELRKFCLDLANRRAVDAHQVVALAQQYLDFINAWQIMPGNLSGTETTRPVAQ